MGNSNKIIAIAISIAVLGLLLPTALSSFSADSIYNINESAIDEDEIWSKYAPASGNLNFQIGININSSYSFQIRLTFSILSNLTFINQSESINSIEANVFNDFTTATSTNTTKISLKLNSSISLVNISYIVSFDDPEAEITSFVNATLIQYVSIDENSTVLAIYLLIPVVATVFIAIAFIKNKNQF